MPRATIFSIWRCATQTTTNACRRWSGWRVRLSTPPSFEELSVKIGQAPADQRDGLEGLRDKLLELTTIIDQQTQAALQEAAGLLQEIVTAPDLDQAIAENMVLLDDTFMAVLAANMQEARAPRRPECLGETQAGLRAASLTALRDNMQPELRFINDLLATESDEAASALLMEQANNYGPVLLDMMDRSRAGAGVTRGQPDPAKADISA